MGIPDETRNLYCPDEELKVSILQEFLIIDQKYSERLDLLDLECYETLRSNIVEDKLQFQHMYCCLSNSVLFSCYCSNENGGWKEDEHFEFQAIIDQHPHDLKNRRQIYIDRCVYICICVIK